MGLTPEPEIPESRELVSHHFRTEITKLEREALEDFREQNINRWERFGDLDSFWAALESHESVGREWIAEWRARSESIFKGEPK